MNVDPAPSVGHLPIYEPIGVPIGDLREDESEASQTTVEPNSLSAIERQFATLVKDLAQQLRGLERQLNNALQQLAKAGQAKEDDNDQAPCAPAGRSARLPYQRYEKIIHECARKHEVDPLLVGAVIQHESGFQPAVVSKAGALGLMQLMPATAHALGIKNVFDPKENIDGGTVVLRQLLDRYHGQLDLALAAYNAGTSAVDKYGGVPPFPETQAYVRNVMETYRETALAT